MTRSAFAASSRLGNAVARNRIKRRMREAVRSLPLQPGWDMVLSARSDAVRSSYQQLRARIAELLVLANVIEEQRA